MGIFSLTEPGLRIRRNGPGYDLFVHEVYRSPRKRKISENVIMFYNTNIEEKNPSYVAFTYIQPQFIVSSDEFEKLY